MSNEPESLLATSIFSALIVCVVPAAMFERLELIPALLIAAAATLPEWAALITDRRERPVVGPGEDPLAGATIAIPDHDESKPSDQDPISSRIPDQTDRSFDLTSDDAEVVGRSDSEEHRTLLTYLEVRRRSIDQCPACGRHDVALVSRDGRFECVVCETTWSCDVGAPWPRTIGDPTRSRRVAPSSIASALDVRDQTVRHQGALEP